jgi:hypothetical protein
LPGCPGDSREGAGAGSLEDLADAGPGWKQALQTGLQPFLLAGLDGTTGRPWDSGEIGKPQDTSSISQVDAAQVLADGWRDVPEQEYAQDAELRAMLGPAGRQFPGLALASQNDLICIINHPPTTDPQAEHIGGYLRTEPGQHLSLSVIRSQDRRAACRLCVPQEVQARGYRSQSLPFSSACLINGRVVTCSCWSRSAVLI